MPGAMHGGHFVALLLIASLSAQELLPARLRQGVEPIAIKIAKAGHGDLLLELRRVLRNLGAGNEKLRKLDAAWAKAGRRAKPKARLPRVAAALRTLARSWATRLGGMEGERKELLALEILAVDSNVDRAHEALGHRRVDGSWVDEAELARRNRRTEIAEASRKAAALPVAVEVSESRHPVLTELYGSPGLSVKAEGIVVHTVLAREKAVRMLRQAVRASALTRWLEEGRLAPWDVAYQFVLLDSKKQYHRSIESARAKGKMTVERAKQVTQLGAFRDQRGWTTQYHLVEVYTQIFLYTDLVRRRARQPCLEAGLLNWVAMAFLGGTLPGFAYTDDETTRRWRGGGATAAPRRAGYDEERRSRWELKEAGIAGCRSWMAWLAANREDPSWSSTFVDRIGKVRGDGLLKATMVVAYLAEEEGLLQPLVKATSTTKHAASDKFLVPVFEEALGLKLIDFESDWREWILPPRNSIADRLDRQERRLTKDERVTLDHLEGLRVRALADLYKDMWRKVALDDELSAGCKAHAEYLVSNPTQALAWPDAHEEYADKPGYSPRGAWAGSNSVIAPGCEGPKQAIDAWMGTFYHRLPLLDPGLRRVGWGKAGEMCVLNAGTLVYPESRWYAVAWPHARMRKVPVSFRPELPNPVPGQDQSKWGYPVTLQVGRFGDHGVDVEVAMELRCGSERGPLVECWFSTPGVPTNPRLAPRRTFCLIPKQTLKGNQMYTVTAKVAGGETLVWWFHT